eukprot:gnl/MRDRNA2_/MRDRNA2_57565_c0_seq1.p1 gnl/MRDRNA2_/MRDRNA2_57565_c0~~gnl/MRDRNA2_/MRDRNA2_57565_c0_seq1.p1  ORF type:complete len:278 (+),score=36.24 gnl/MRDRNA2_/MRDRNA2_57565_c0_seq1:76-909(+)
MCAAPSRGFGGGGTQHNSPYSVIVFLDIDGVLHSLYGNDLFRPTCMAHIDRILRTSGASVVLSSTWRTVPRSYNMVNETLRARGLPIILDVTKDFNPKGDAGGQYVPREVEICEWLDRHPEVQRWIAIDDMQLMNPETKEGQRMRGHFVRTDCNVGLTSKHADLALRLLGIDPNSKAPPADFPFLESKGLAASGVLSSYGAHTGASSIQSMRSTDRARSSSNTAGNRKGLFRNAGAMHVGGGHTNPNAGGWSGSHAREPGQSIGGRGRLPGNLRYPR